MTSIFGSKKKRSKYISIKLDDSPSIIVGKLVKETSTDLFVFFPLMVGFFANQGSSLAAMGIVQGVQDSDVAEDMFLEPPEVNDMCQDRVVGILARKLQPFSDNEIVSFSKSKVISRTVASPDMIAFCEQFQKKFGTVMEDSLRLMVEKMNPLLKPIMEAPENSMNLVDPVDSGEESYSMPETLSKMIH